MNRINVSGGFAATLYLELLHRMTLLLSASTAWYFWKTTDMREELNRLAEVQLLRCGRVPIEQFWD
ncbi:hypothetical protein QPK13_22425 [Photorhabdus tasmaniensis]